MCALPQGCTRYVTHTTEQRDRHIGESVESFFVTELMLQLLQSCFELVLPAEEL